MLSASAATGLNRANAGASTFELPYCYATGRVGKGYGTYESESVFFRSVR